MDLLHVIRHGWPGADFDIDGDSNTLDDLTWRGPGNKPTQEEIDATYSSYKRFRKREELTERFRKARDGGTTVTFDGVNEFPLATTHAAQQEISGIKDHLQAGGTISAATRAGDVIEWTHELAGIALNAVQSHIAACYENEALLTTVISEAEDLDSVDIEIGWP